MTSNHLTSRRLRLVAATAASLAAFALVGCGSDSSDTAETTSATTTTTTSTSTSTTETSTTTTETTATTANAAQVEKFCSVYKSYLEWSMKPENSDTMEKAYTPPGVPLTDANRQAIQTLITRTQDANRDMLEAAPDEIKSDLEGSNEYLERSLRERLDSPVGIMASPPTPDEAAASQRLLDYTSANCPGLPA